MAKNIIELNNNEIRKILSDKFNVDIKDVNLDICTEMQGYGMAEHEVTTVKAVITRRNFNYD